MVIRATQKVSAKVRAVACGCVAAAARLPTRVRGFVNFVLGFPPLEKNFCAAAFLISSATFAPACRIHFQLQNGYPGKKLLCCSVFFNFNCSFRASSPSTFSIAKYTFFVAKWSSWKKSFVLQRCKFQLQFLRQPAEGHFGCKAKSCLEP